MLGFVGREEARPGTPEGDLAADRVECGVTSGPLWLPRQHVSFQRPQPGHSSLKSCCLGT